jgi:hypothetical protein
MSIEVHIDWEGQTHLVGRFHAAERGPSVSFEYAPEWLQREDAFAIDPASLPLQRGLQHAKSLFGVVQDSGPDRWGRMLIERAVRKKVLQQKPYRDIDYGLALDDTPRVVLCAFEWMLRAPFLPLQPGNFLLWYASTRFCAQSTLFMMKPKPVRTCASCWGRVRPRRCATKGCDQSRRWQAQRLIGR